VAALTVAALLRLVVLVWADAERVALATSELATHLVRYAEGGEISLSIIEGPRQRGIELVSHDRGPGIPYLAQALQDGFSTGQGLGSSLPGVRRLMDELEITSSPTGTTVVARTWPHRW
jgi:serine/threonine-protein kinase RsbT